MEVSASRFCMTSRGVLHFSLRIPTTTQLHPSCPVQAVAQDFARCGGCCCSRWRLPLLSFVVVVLPQDTTNASNDILVLAYIKPVRENGDPSLGTLPCRCLSSSSRQLTGDPCSLKQTPSLLLPPTLLATALKCHVFAVPALAQMCAVELLLSVQRLPYVRSWCECVDSRCAMMPESKIPPPVGFETQGSYIKPRNSENAKVKWC